MASDAVVCSVCGAVDDQLGPGPGGRPSAACRSCGSLERHRLLALLLGGLGDRAAQGAVVLDVAPSRNLSPLIRALRPDAYVSLDFDPAADGRLVSVAASLTDVPLVAGSVGLLVCYHVLEHIPDDAAAMREIARVLHPGGVALVQVPRRSGPTDEDPSAPVEERVSRFGQADHVRYYGDDFEDRLRSAGLSVVTTTAVELVPREWQPLLGIDSTEVVWLCTRNGSPRLEASILAAEIPFAVFTVLDRSARQRLRTRQAAAPAPRAPRPPASLPRRIYRRVRRALR